MENHKLIVNGPDDFEIVHPSTCPTEYNSAGKYDQYTCSVQFEVDNCGLSYFFDHVDNREENGCFDDTTYLTNGEYDIEYWSETYNHWEYGPEYTSGLQLVEEPL